MTITFLSIFVVVVVTMIFNIIDMYMIMIDDDGDDDSTSRLNHAAPSVPIFMCYRTPILMVMVMMIMVIMRMMILRNEAKHIEESMVFH